MVTSTGATGKVGMHFIMAQYFIIIHSYFSTETYTKKAKTIFLSDLHQQIYINIIHVYIYNNNNNNGNLARSTSAAPKVLTKTTLHKRKQPQQY